MGVILFLSVHGEWCEADIFVQMNVIFTRFYLFQSKGPHQGTKLNVLSRDFAKNSQ